MLLPLYCQPEYQVDSDGYVISKKFHRPLKSAKNPQGYHIVSISKDGKQVGMSVHGAIAKTFLGDKTDEGMQVNHKNGDKDDNSLKNLEWITPKENMVHSVQVLGNCLGIKNHNAKAIIAKEKRNEEHIIYFGSLIDAANYICKGNPDKCRHTQNSIWRALNGKRKSYKGFIWEYGNYIAE